MGEQQETIADFHNKLAWYERENATAAKREAHDVRKTKRAYSSRWGLVCQG